MLSPITFLGLILIAAGVWMAFQLRKRTRNLIRIPATVRELNMENAESLDHKPVQVYVPVYEYQVEGETRVSTSSVKLENTRLSKGDKVYLRYNTETGEISPENELRIARNLCLGVMGAGLAIILLVWIEMRTAV